MKVASTALTCRFRTDAQEQKSHSPGKITTLIRSHLALYLQCSVFLSDLVLFNWSWQLSACSTAVDYICNSGSHPNKAGGHVFPEHPHPRTTSWRLVSDGVKVHPQPPTPLRWRVVHIRRQHTFCRALAHSTRDKYALYTYADGIFWFAFLVRHVQLINKKISDTSNCIIQGCH